MIADFFLTVALGIVWGGKVMLDPILLAESSYFLAGEVGLVIRDDGMRYAKEGDDVYL